MKNKKVTIIAKTTKEDSCKGCVGLDDKVGCSGFLSELMVTLGLPTCIDNNVIYVVKK